jgi:hypothetical protein
LADHYGVTVEVIRSTVWANLARLVMRIGVASMLSTPVQNMLAAASAYHEPRSQVGGP